MVSRARPLAGLVLCGGRSTRMGQDKALLEIDGVPMVRRAAAALSTVAIPVILAPGVPGRLGGTDYAEVADAAVDSGPLGGLVAGLEASPHRLMAVVAVDLPRLSPGVLRLLAELGWSQEEGSGQGQGFDAAVPTTAAGPQPLHAVYATSALPALAAALAGGRLALHQALADLDVRIVGEPEWRQADPTGRFADNINEPADLAVVPPRR